MLYGGDGGDVLAGGSGIDFLYGDGGGDFFALSPGAHCFGGDGDDTFVLQAGYVEELTGGAGADRYQIDVTREAGLGAMRILDFNPAEDQILVTTLETAAPTFRFVEVDATAHIYNLIVTARFEMPDGPASTNDYTLLTFVGVPLTGAEVLGSVSTSLYTGGGGGG